MDVYRGFGYSWLWNKCAYLARATPNDTKNTNHEAIKNSIRCCNTDIHRIYYPYSNCYLDSFSNIIAIIDTLTHLLRA